MLRRLVALIVVLWFVRLTAGDALACVELPSFDEQTHACCCCSIADAPVGGVVAKLCCQSMCGKDEDGAPAAPPEQPPTPQQPAVLATGIAPTQPSGGETLPPTPVWLRSTRLALVAVERKPLYVSHAAYLI